MRRKFVVTQMISYLLVALYAILSWNFFILFQQKLAVYWAGFAAAFFVLAVCSISTAAMKGWGRRAVVILNVAVCLAALGIFLAKGEMVLSWPYLVLFVAVAVFFHQRAVKGKFGYFEKDKWECVLLIDDDPTTIAAARPILVNNGYSVLTANTGEDGLEMAKNQKPDLILLDVILPGMKGRDVCRQLKEAEETRNIPVVFFTAKNSKDDIEAEIAAGAETHLTKPVSPKELLTVVRKILDRK